MDSNLLKNMDAPGFFFYLCQTSALNRTDIGPKSRSFFLWRYQAISNINPSDIGHKSDLYRAEVIRLQTDFHNFHQLEKSTLPRLGAGKEGNYDARIL